MKIFKIGSSVKALKNKGFVSKGDILRFDYNLNMYKVIFPIEKQNEYFLSKKIVETAFKVFGKEPND